MTPAPADAAEGSPPHGAAPLTPEEAWRLLGARLADGAVLAVSGGPDSMALLGLAALTAARFSPPPDLLAVTIDHRLRPESADEARLVDETAARLGVRHRTIVWNEGTTAPNLQAAARLARYRLLAAAAREANLPRILTAHHLDDQAETVLMRLRRSVEPRALAGISPVVPLGEDLRVERPFLAVPKARLVATVATLGLPHVVDPGNSDPRFERARLRAAPPILREGGATAERLATLADHARAAAERIEREALSRLDGEVSVDEFGRIEGPLEMFRPPRAIALAVLRRVAMAAAGRTDSPGRDGLLGILRLVQDARVPADPRRAPRHARTLHAVRFTVEGAAFAASREWGRSGPATVPLPATRVSIWDGRFRIPPGLPDGLDVGPFGRTGRGAARERTMPALFRHGICVAVPEVLVRRAPEGAATFAPACIVRERLLMPHIGGLGDRLSHG